MKKICTIVLFSAACLFTGACLHAQDSTKPGAIKQINRSSERADNLHGKKIQQQSLSNNHFEKLNTIAVNKSLKKKHSKSRRKHQ